MHRSSAPTRRAAPGSNAPPSQQSDAAVRAAGAHGERASLVLAACQALYTSSVSIDLTLTGLVGFPFLALAAAATLALALK